MTGKKLLTPENLRAYQRLIIDHQLDQPRNGIWVPMGLGKTAATLTTIDALQMAGEDSPTLILAPLRVAKTVWPEEVLKWQHTKHMKIVPICGTEKQRIQALKYSANVYTANYESLPWLTDYLGDRWMFKTVIADEASKLKNFRLRQGGQRTAALAKVTHTHVTRFLQLTGSPASNGLHDIWAPAWFLDRGNRLGRTYSAFQKRWFRQNPNGFGSSPMEGAQEEIQDLLRDLYLTIDAKDYFDLQDTIVTTIEVDLPKKARELYDQLEKDFFIRLESGHEVDAFSAGARSQKMLQLASGACYLHPDVENDEDPKARAWELVHNEKLDALDDIIEETGGVPIIICYQFLSDLARLRKKYPHGKWLSNDKEMKDFKTGQHSIAFAHPRSVGHGVNDLEKVCNIQVNFSSSWGLEDMEQMAARTGPVRQFQSGTGKASFIYNIVARGTIDEVVAERLVSKTSMQDALKEAMKRRKEGT